MKVKKILFSIALFWSMKVYGFDYSRIGLCRNADGRFSNINSLKCQTDPVLLSLLQSDLKLKKCEDKKQPPKIQSGEKPVSAVFIACAPSSKKSCVQIATSLLENKTNATVNILVDQNELSDEELLRKFEKLLDLAETEKSPLNIIPVHADDPEGQRKREGTKFLRDPGVFRVGPGQLEYITLPDFAPSNVTSMAEDIKIACENSFKIQKSYGDPNEWLSIYQKMISDQVSRSEVNELNKVLTLRGGNLLPLPNGHLLFGLSSYGAPPEKMLNTFEKNQPIDFLQIPNLHIGHIDEVFNIVPSSDSCGFSILRASPMKAKAFLESRRNSNDKFITGQFTKLKTANEILEDPVFGYFSQANQKIINDSTEKLLNLLKPDLPQDCKPKVIDLPVFWDILGNPLYPNPVNGISVNGHFFYSEPTSLLHDKSSSSPHGLKEWIETELRTVFGSHVHSVKTTEYDQGQGNLHCATTQISVPCISE